MQPFKKLLVVIGLLAVGLIGGGLAGFGIIYIIAANERGIPHGALNFLMFFTLMGAVMGVIAGAATARRVVGRM